MDKFECDFDDVEPSFCQHITPTEPFGIQICYNYVNVFRLLTEKIEQTNNTKKKAINTEKTFLSDECVICLTKPPNVLFCNCGHLCLCAECNKVKDLYTCPVCKFENTIKKMYNI